MSRLRLLIVPSIILLGLAVWQRFLLQPPLGWVSTILLLPAIWVGVDARRTQPQQYHTSLAYPPMILFLLAAGFPIIVLPWYLTVRDLIRSGRALRRVAPAPTPKPAA